MFGSAQSLSNILYAWHKGFLDVANCLESCCCVIRDACVYAFTWQEHSQTDRCTDGVRIDVRMHVRTDVRMHVRTGVRMRVRTDVRMVYGRMYGQISPRAPQKSSFGSLCKPSRKCYQTGSFWSFSCLVSTQPLLTIFQHELNPLKQHNEKERNNKCILRRRNA